MEKAFSVNFWGSHPDDENDDCFEGEEFGSLAEARAAFHSNVRDRDVAYVELDGPDVNEVRKNPGYRPSREDHDWQREMANEAGMLHGIDAYNDEMGY